MKQILHIFQKDTRRLWPEILLSIMATAAIVCVLPLQWTSPPTTIWGANNARMMDIGMLGRGLTLLLVISWAILIVRSIHAEGLVGDRQFWLTRPYVWIELLGAKLLFLAAFVFLPLVIAQCLLLVLAGLNPLASVGGLAFNLLLIAGMLVLPLVAIAAVTADFTRMTLTVLAILLGVGVLVSVVTMHLSFGVEGSLIGKLLFLALGDPFLPSNGAISVGHHSQLPIAVLLLAVCGTAIALQYALRRTPLSRMVLLSLPIALTVLVLLTAHGSGPANPFTDPTYPPLAAGATPPVQLSYAPDEKHPLYVSRGESPVGISIPLGFSGLAADSAVIAGPYPRVTITGADGFTWSANAGELYPEKFVSTRSRTHVGFHIPRTDYDRLKHGQVTISLSFALTQLQAIDSIRIPMPTRDVMVPGLGVCRRPDLNHAILVCRSALREPQLTYASADWSQTPCPASQPEIEQVRGDPWMGMLNADPAEFGVAPILFTSFVFMPDMNNTTGGKYLCAGAPITFTRYRLAGRVQSTLIIPNLDLPED
jgi:hypothetical protein